MEKVFAPKNQIILTIDAHQPFVFYEDKKHDEQKQWLFFALSETYLPLLDVCSNLEADGIPFKFSLALSPILCDMLVNPIIQQQYIEWLECTIARDTADLEVIGEHNEKATLTRHHLERTYKLLSDFVEVYQQNILTKFDYFAVKGYIELLATTATHVYIPLYMDLTEVIDAQIDWGVQSYKKYFQTPLSGFWLPELGYEPGIEKFLKKYGFSYTILDTRGVLFAEPTPSNGVFVPCQCQNGFGVFARDTQSYWDVCKESDGYMYHPQYFNQTDADSDVNNEAVNDFLSKTHMSISTDCRYWQNQTNTAYNAEAAFYQVVQDAEHFLNSQAHKLSQAAEQMKHAQPSIVCTFSANVLGQRWHEGIMWLDQLFRQAAQRSDIHFDHYEAVFHQYPTLQTIEPVLSAANGAGYGEDLLNNSNDWMYPYIRKALKRMIDLAQRFPNDFSLKERSLNMAAREVLLAQDDVWAQMTNDGVHADYAYNRFKEHIANFTYIYDSLGANCMSTEWLTTVEREHPVFPHINYRVFRKKV